MKIKTPFILTIIRQITDGAKALDFPHHGTGDQPTEAILDTTLPTDSDFMNGKKDQKEVIEADDTAKKFIIIIMSTKSKTISRDFEP